MLALNQIYNIDCLEGLGMIDDGIVQCCVTSPPYYGLRDYKITPTRWPKFAYYPMTGVPYQIEIPEWEGCLGLEPTVEMYIGHMVMIFREVHRTLRNDGTLWLNLADSFVGTGGDRNKAVSRKIFNLQQSHNPQSGRYEKIKAVRESGLKPKDLMGIPWRVALALQADGWYLRSDIIWNKTNCMPESAVDRPTKCHEYIFLFSKSRKYYYDKEAIKEPCVSGDTSSPRGSRGTLGTLNKGRRLKGNAITFRGGGIYTKGRSFHNSKQVERESHGNKENSSGLRNKRTVWTVATENSRVAHYATFPQRLIEPCIRAGAPVGGIVLDPFMGTGTTALVAITWQRNYLGFELNPGSVKIAKEDKLKIIQLRFA